MRLRSIYALVLILAATQFACAGISTSQTTQLQAETIPSLSPVPTLTRIPSIPSPSTAPTPIQAAEQNAYTYLESICQTVGARPPGSPEEARAGEYIREVLQGMGYEVQIQEFSFNNEDGEVLHSANLIATKPGIQSAKIVVGAHYDSSDEGEGADDNASGVAVLLETAGRVSKSRTTYTIHFIAFGAEENDLDGSRYYVSQMGPAEIQNTVGMINLDSLIAGDQAYVYGDTDKGSLRNWILSDARNAGHDLQGKSDTDMNETDGTLCECADYSPFEAEGIPFAYFEATNWDLGEQDGMTQVETRFGEDGEIRHTEFDRVDYLEETFPGRISQNLSLFSDLLYNVLVEYP